MDEKDINIEHPIGSNDGPRSKLNAYNWLSDIPGDKNDFDMVEVQFKNTRRGFYKNSMNLPLQVGDIVAVEANPGHDIGRVSMIGKLVRLQMKKANLRADAEIRRVFRKAKASDLEKFEAAKAREYDTMIRSRRIAKDLNLNMKIGDVEYQGDGNKAIFYYIADGRVDFRKLIKVLADAFHVRIEMKQIGARQEAGRIGGIGPCGRELCCATWMKNFSSVSTAAARFQDITPNPQKLAGQCAKLKCCLNYEVDTYMEAARRLPERSRTLETADATYYFFKADVLAGTITYSTDRRMAVNLVVISVERAWQVIEMNAEGQKPLRLESDEEPTPSRSHDLAVQDDLTRFDTAKKKNRRKKRGGGRSGEEGTLEGERESEPRDNERGGQRQGHRKSRPFRDGRGGRKQER